MHDHFLNPRTFYESLNYFVSQEQILNFRMFFNSWTFFELAAGYGSAKIGALVVSQGAERSIEGSYWAGSSRDSFGETSFLSLIGGIGGENTQELLGAPHPYTKINRKKYKKNQKGAEFWEYQTWVPGLLPCEISWKNTRKRIRGEGNTVGTKIHPNSVFLCIGNFCLFCHEYISWYFFTNFHTGVDQDPGLISQNYRFFF